MKKMILVIAAAASLIGCSHREAGMCATAIGGVCVGRYDESLNVVPVGGVDMRFAGFECRSDSVGTMVCSGKASVSAESWE